MRFIVLIVILISFVSGFAMCNKSLTLDQKTITYTGNFSLPNDPLDIETMEDYELIGYPLKYDDPGTWMSLILMPGGSFMDVTEHDIESSKEILQLKDRGAVIAGYINFLRHKQLEGSYIPLYHFSTLTLGRENLSFDRIGDLDETVEFVLSLLR